MDDLNFIRKNLNSENLLFGEEQCLRAIKASKAKKVFLSLNAKESLVKDLERYSALKAVEIIKLTIDNIELGAVCKKLYPIGVITLTE
jgi:ribosomal protein L30E